MARSTGYAAALAALSGPQRRAVELTSVPAVGGLPAQRGTGVYDASNYQGGGVAWPLTEGAVSVSATPRTLTSTDGVMTFQLYPDAESVINEADGNPGKIIWNTEVI